MNFPITALKSENFKTDALNLKFIIHYDFPPLNLCPSVKSTQDFDPRIVRELG